MILSLVGILGSTSHLNLPMILPLSRMNGFEASRLIRHQLIQSVRKQWIVGVLDNILSESRAFDVFLEVVPEAVVDGCSLQNYAVPNTRKIVTIFKDMNRQLLILGQPGAGKTVLLLQLARELLNRADQDEKEAVPIIFSLSSWSSRDKDFLQWLLSEFWFKYSIETKAAKRILEDGRAILLLDGLDEIKEEARKSCVEAINSFRKSFNFLDVAVCSRTQDYDELKSKLDLNCAITLLPLDDKQINKYLSGRDYAALRNLLHSDPEFKNMAQVPFLLNIMAYTYRDASSINLKGIKSHEDRKKHLFDNYVQQRFRRLTHTYTLQRSKRYLSWLSGAMLTNNQPIYYSILLQPSWLNNDVERKIYAILVGLFYGSSLGTITTLLMALELHLPLSILIGVFVGATYGASSTVIILKTCRFIEKISKADFIKTVDSNGPKTNKETVQEPVSTEPQSTGDRSRQNRVLGAIMGALGSWIMDNMRFGMINFLVASLVLSTPLALLVGIVSWTSWWLLVDPISLFIGVSVTEKPLYPVIMNFNSNKTSLHKNIADSITIALSVLLINILLESSIVQVLYSLTISLGIYIFLIYLWLLLSRPLDRIINKVPLFWNTLTTFCTIFVALGIGINPIIGFLFACCRMLLRIEGRFYIRYLILRAILSFNGKLPLNMHHFLNEMVSLVILRRLGDGYMFIHRSLQDYFLEQHSG